MMPYINQLSPNLSRSARTVEARLHASLCPSCGGWLLADHPAYGVWCGACRLNWYVEDFDTIRATLARLRERARSCPSFPLEVSA